MSLAARAWFAERPLPFGISSVAKGYGDACDFAGWQAVTAQDKGSKFGAVDAGYGGGWANGVG